jgi:16S rRNA (guanine527-N7)-methyltransferase
MSEDIIEQDFTPEVEPAIAAVIFGEGVAKARSYAALLIRDGDILGLLGPREMPKIWTRHILNSAVVAELLQSGETVADVGSGAGLPGIPMAIVRPDVHFTLIEPMERRSDWLIDVVEELGLKNVSVLRARAEDVGEVFDVVTARAVSALPKLLRLCVPMTRDGGRILALKGSKAADEINEARGLMKKLKIENFEIVQAGAQSLTEPTTVVRTTLS